VASNRLNSKFRIIARGRLVRLVKFEDAWDWLGAVPVDRLLGDAKADDYDALVPPGGQINPDLLRIDSREAFSRAIIRALVQ
jgi:putative intracellular protease/amidase